MPLRSPTVYSWWPAMQEIISARFSPRLGHFVISAARIETPLQGCCSTTTTTVEEELRLADGGEASALLFLYSII